MSLQLLIGNSGAGKSQKLYEKVIEESILNPKKNYFVIVPEQFTMETQKEMVMRHPSKGILNIDILSFGRLAYRVFEETGTTPGVVLDDEGKNLILRKIAGAHKDELHILGANLKKIGYISEVKSVISEFTQYDISIEELEDFLVEISGDSMLSYKLQDIKVLYQAFQDYLSERYITGEEMLDLLCNVVKDSLLLKDSVVVFDGFTGFTPVQNRLIQSLLQVVDELRVTITMDTKEDPFLYKTPYQLFAISKETATNLVSLAKESDVEIKETLYFKESQEGRFRKNKPLAFLEKQLFRFVQQEFEEEQESLRIYRLKNPKSECEWVVRMIRQLVRTKSYRFRDIGVIVTDMNAYASHLKKACLEYEIPIFTDHKRDIMLNSFIEYIRALLDMILKNFTYESVFRFLKTQMSPFPIEDIDFLENYILGMGIRGYKRWQEPFLDEVKGETKEGLEDLNHMRFEFIELITPLRNQLTKRGNTVSEITLLLYEFLASQNVEKKLEEYSREFGEKGEYSLEKEYSQVYKVIMELFDKFVDLLGDEVVTLQEYIEILDSGIMEARIGMIPPALDSVVIGDIERTRLHNIKTLFLVGANDQYLPGKMNTSGLLTQRDREKFEVSAIRLQPNAKEQIYIQKFYLYTNLTKPSQELIISYAQSNAEGAALRPSYLIGEIRNIFPKIKIKAGNQQKNELIPEKAIAEVVAGFREKSKCYDARWLELYSWYKRQEKWNPLLQDTLEYAFQEKNPKRLSATIAQKLYGENLENSVSRLEAFSRCPYAHFLTYGLAISERKEYDFASIDMGNVFHKAIEVYSKKLEKNHLEWSGISKEKQDQFIKESVADSVDGYGNNILYSSARNTYIVKRMERLLKRTIWALTEQLKRGEFIPAGYEVMFSGKTNLESANIQISETETMKLKGKIDRIDTFETNENIYVKVIDYKTGTSKLDIVAMYYGLQLQLFVYLNAAMELEKKKHEGKEVFPAGVFYYRMDDPIIETREKEEIEEKILEALRLDGLVSAEANVINAFDADLEAKSSVIPVTKNKNGELSKTSKAVSLEDFYRINKHVEKSISKIGEEIVTGNIDVYPFERKEEKGCTFCSYGHICGFPYMGEEARTRKLEEIDKEEVLERLREED